MKVNKSIFLKKKYVAYKGSNNINVNLYGQNYISLNNKLNLDLSKTYKQSASNVRSDIINYNYNNMVNYNQFFNILVLNKIK